MILKIASNIGYILSFMILTAGLLAFLAFLFTPSVYEKLFYEGDFISLATENHTSIYLIQDPESEEKNMMANRSLARIKGNTNQYNVTFSILDRNSAEMKQVQSVFNLKEEDIKYPAVLTVSDKGDIIGFYQDGVPTEYLSYLIPKATIPKGE